MRQAALAGDVLHEIERNAERVVEPERFVARQHLRSCRRAIERLFEARQPRREHGVEPLLFAAHDLHDRVAIAAQLRIRVAHLARRHVDERRAGTAR